MNEIVRILIVDDSAYVRKVIRQMLSRSPFLEVIGAARDGREALEMADELQPDVITCDLIMPELDGIAATLNSSIYHRRTCKRTIRIINSSIRRL